MSRKKLAIVGLANGWEAAPLADASWDVWRCNPGFWASRIIGAGSTLDTVLPYRPSAWFEIHTRRYLTRAHGKEHIRAIELVLGIMAAPTYFLDPRDWKVTGRQLFPRAVIAREFPRGDYHAGSFDWLLAFAILSEYKHIELFGIDLGPTDQGEPLSARPCMEYWCGLAAGRGVTVVSHGPSLFKLFNYQRCTTPYHYDDTWRLVEDRRRQ